MINSFLDTGIMAALFILYSYFQDIRKFPPLESFILALIVLCCGIMVVMAAWSGNWPILVFILIGFLLLRRTALTPFR